MFSLTSGIGPKPILYTDPFKKESFASAAIYIGFHSKNPMSYRGRISFLKGDTQGEQSFNADDLPSLVQKMEAFMQSLD